MSMSVPVRDDRAWVAADLVELIPEDVDWRRFEIVDGALVVSPPAVPVHELLVLELGAALKPFVPAGFRVTGSIGIELGHSYRIPDVTVVDEQVFRTGQPRITADQVLLAIEIESSSSITTDRITKPAQYAAAGIPHYWRVELDPLRLNAYRLAGDVYEHLRSWGAADRARITDPFDVTIDLSTLLP